MTDLIILITSLALAAAGIIQSNKAGPERRAVWGMTKVGLGLLVVACIGFTASAAKQLLDSREAERLRRQAEEDAMLLKVMNAKIDYILGETDEPVVVRELEKLKDQMNLAASRSRATDFSLSDFSLSRFDNGNFTLTYFPGALFKSAGFYDARFDESNFKGASFSGAFMDGADFRGVDLSKIIIDDKTTLPSR